MGVNYVVSCGVLSRISSGIDAREKIPGENDFELVLAIVVFVFITESRLQRGFNSSGKLNEKA